MKPTPNQGPNNGNAVLTTREALAIRRARGVVPQRVLARGYKVSVSCVAKIHTALRWAWLQS